MEVRNASASEKINTSGDDTTTWALPEGAIARFGQGLVETLAFSADGYSLAIGTRVGLWVYEVATLLPLVCGAWKIEKNFMRLRNTLGNMQSWISQAVHG